MKKVVQGLFVINKVVQGPDLKKLFGPVGCKSGFQDPGWDEDEDQTVTENKAFP